MAVDWKNVKVHFDNEAKLHINAVDCGAEAKSELGRIADRHDLGVVERPGCWEIIMPCPPDLGCPGNMICGGVPFRIDEG